MYTMHLWIELSESTEEQDCGKFNLKTSELREFIDNNFGSDSDKFDIFDRNFTRLLVSHVSHNRDIGYRADLEALLTWISKNLPGSYGLAYILDDESMHFKKCGGFEVIRLAKGLIDKYDDPFLSPIVPTIED